MMLRMAWLEAKLLLREPMTLVFTLGLPVVMELVMGGVFGNTAEAGFYRGVGAMDYYMGAYVGLVVLAFLIAALAFAAIGILLGVSMPTARAAQGAGILLWFVMLILGGAGPPPEVLSTGMRAVGSATPLKHVVTLIQDPWLGFGWSWAETGIVAAFLIGAVALIATVTHRQSDR